MSIGNDIRVATLADAAAIQAIYAPVVKHTTISFEIEPPTVAQMAERIESNLAVSKGAHTHLTGLIWTI
jgi:L-amino acid N-acyltransferase YncA